MKLRNLATNQSRTVITDEQGVYRLTELAVETYEVRVEHPGFAPYVHTGVTVSVGQSVLAIQLVPPSISTQVTVTDQPSAIDPSQTSVTSTVDTEKIEELPVRSRNYLQFVLLAPGVAASNGQPASNGQTPLADSGFTFGGLRARSNNLSIDGLDNNDEFTGASRTELSLEIVREFQVVNNGLSAESGGASGGSINVVTKTGSNVIHGDAFLFAQSGALNARSPFSNQTQKPDLNRYRAGFALGGPLAKDRTFYYTAFEQEHTRAEATSDIDPAIAQAVNSFLRTGAFSRLATRRIATGFFPITRAETEASVKLNHQINQRQSLMLRYAFTNNREAGDAFNTGGLADSSARGSSFVADHALVGSLVSLLGASAINDLRFQFATRRVVLRTNDTIGPEMIVPGILDAGRPYEGNGRRRENHYQVSDNLSLAKGAHLLRAGLTINRVRLHTAAPDGFGAVYLFANLADFFNGRADSFRQGFGNDRTNSAVTSYGGFVQDHLSKSFSAGRQLTVDLGLRYDYERLPDAFNQDINNFSPRIGVAFSPTPRWVMRAGYGIFFDRYVLANLNRALAKNGAQAFEQVADGDTAAALFQAAAGGPLGTTVTGLPGSIFRPDPTMATPYSQQANLGTEFLVGKNLTAGLNYLFVRGVKLPRTRNVNLLPGVVLTRANAGILGISNPMPQQLGRPVFGPGRQDGRFTDIYQLENAASSAYHGISLSLNRRLANEFEFSANYTLSRTHDDASDFDEQPENPFALQAERALSGNHQGHRFVFSALFDLPFGEEERKPGQPSPPPKGGSKYLGDILGHIEIAPIISLASGRPANPLVGLDANRAHAFPVSARPLGFGRNSLRTPRTFATDLRVLKYFKVGAHGKLDFVAEFFNLFNHANISHIDSFFGPNLNPGPGFGRRLDASNPRQVQFSIDFEF